jgi:hypothetical protein
LHGDVGRVLDAGSQPLGIYPELLGGSPSFGDILDMSHEKPRCVVLISHEGNVGQAPNDMSIAVRIAFLN